MNEEVTPVKFDIIIWAHSDQTGGAELACEIFVRFRDLYKGLGRGERVAIACPEEAEKFARQRLFATIGFDVKCVIKVQKSISIVKTSDGSVDPVKTEEQLREKFGTRENLRAFMLEYQDKLAVHIHSNTLFVSCGEPMAVAFAKERGLRCVIVTDILMPDAVQRVLEYGGRLSPEAARALTTLSNFDREADEAYLAPPEFCGTGYDTSLASGAVPARSIGGLFYLPPNRLATDKRHNVHLRRLVEAAGDDRVVFVFGGGGQVWLGVYEYLSNMLKQKLSRPKYALLLPAIERREQKPNDLSRVTDGGVFQYTLFKPNGEDIRLGDPGSLSSWYAVCDLVVGRGGLVAQQVLALMLSDNPPVHPFLHFIEEIGHPQIEAERQALQRMRFVTSATFDAFRKAPFEEIERAINTKTAESTEIMRLRVRARYGTDCLDHAISAIIQAYL